MDGVTTMNLADSGGDGTPVSFGAPEPSKEFKIPQGLVMPNDAEKNINKEKEMDSTPISDLMGGDMATGSPDPRLMMNNPSMYMQQAVAQSPSAKPPGGKKNPMNLTDDQMEALFAGIVAVIAFSIPVQMKFSTMIPQYLSESGERTTVGTIASAVLVAALFYFGKRFIMPSS